MATNCDQMPRGALSDDSPISRMVARDWCAIKLCDDRELLACVPSSLKRQGTDVLLFSGSHEMKRAPAAGKKAVARVSKKSRTAVKEVVKTTRFWLMKTEPDVFSIDDLRKLGKSPWDGVRNYQARNFMKQMQIGDEVLIYHSNANPPGIAGLGRVCRTAYPDHTAQDKNSKYYDAKASKDKPIWEMVDIEFVRKFRFVSREELAADHSAISGMILWTNSRLSVQPCAEAAFVRCVALGDGSTVVRR